MTPSDTPPQNPFSTILSVKILQMIRERDLANAKLLKRHHALRITTEELTAQLEASEAKIADEILEVCTRTIATLEATVNTVLQLQAQMKVLRDAN